MDWIWQTIAQALKLHQEGAYDRAEALYRQVLAADPRNADANHLLGVLAHHTGNNELAVQLIQRALMFQPATALFHFNLGLAQDALGRLDEAVSSYRQAARLDPNYTKAFINLGICLRRSGKLDDAVASSREAVRLEPDHIEARQALGIALRDQGRHEEAAGHFRHILHLQPQHPGALGHLGMALRHQGRLAEARDCLAAAARLGPTGWVLHELGSTQLALGEDTTAEESFRAAIRLQPDLIEAGTQLAILMRKAGRYEEALALLERVVQIKGNATAYNLLGHLHLEAGPFEGRVERSLSALRQACDLAPHLWKLHSNLLLVLHYSTAVDRDQIFAEHRRWSKLHEEPLAGSLKALACNRSPGRRPLRIGYVSPDFRTHVVSLNMEGVLASHDHERFHITCYANLQQPDEVTRRYQGFADRWRDIRGLSDAQAAELIRADGIDILVDLAGHMIGGRPLVFAHRPAPVRVNYLVYPDTSGMAAMNYRITDAYLDPPGESERFHTEKLMRLPEVAYCYLPGVSPEVGPLPCRNGPVTFGALNRLTKVSGAVITTWSRILQAVPGSRLLLLNNAATSENPPVRDAFAAHGIEPGRVTLAGLRGRYQYLELYRDVDIALDPFPYNGCVTTCDALWMGVPVIALAGDAFVSRQGVSLLATVGLGDLVTRDADSYVQKAIQLAAEPARLAAIRASLRTAVQRSPLGDTRRFTRQLEDVYEKIWTEWCATPA